MLNRSSFCATTKEEFEQDNTLLQERNAIIVSLKSVEYKPVYNLVTFIYSAYHDQLFFILGNNITVKTGKILNDDGTLLNKVCLLEIYRDYEAIFLQVNNPVELLNNKNAGESYFNLWRKLFAIFVLPLIYINQGIDFKEILYKFNISFGKKNICINLGLLYDLSFRFLHQHSNTSLYFTHVSNDAFVEYLHDINRLPFPLVSDITIAYGLDRLTGGQKPYNTKIAAREKIVDEMIYMLQLQGGSFTELKDMDTLSELLSKNSKRNVIQLIAHFHDNIIQLQHENYVFLSRLVNLINKKKHDCNFNDNIIIDAVTCNNYTDFQAIKKAGIRYIYFSNHYISTDWALLTLRELFGCHIAKELGWQVPYLNREVHLHIAYANVIRAFFLMMNKKNIIKIKTMKKEIIIEGKGLKPFLSFIEAKTEKFEKENIYLGYDFKPKFIKDDETLNADLVGIVLSGASNALIQAIAGFSFSSLKNNVTIKFKDNYDREITISSKNKTDAEIIELLKSAGINV